MISTSRGQKDQIKMMKIRLIRQIKTQNNEERLSEVTVICFQSKSEMRPAKSLSFE